MILMSIPSMLFYASGNLTKTKDLKSALTKISMGNIGASTSACSTGKYEKIGLDYVATINL
jgi:hypothetical protein